MGSMNKRPKAPPVQQVVYTVPAPQPSSGHTSSEDASKPEISEEEQASENRRQNLLRRNRGRLGTVLTGFRGVLTSSSANPQQKTLLGE